MAALLFPSGSIVNSSELIDLEIWETPTEDSTGIILQLVVQSNIGERFIIAELPDDATNRSIIEAKRDNVAAHLWGTVTDVTSI
jgi:hypothetical protein